MKKVKTVGNEKLSGYFRELRKKRYFLETIEKLRGTKDGVAYYQEVYALCDKYNLRPYPWREIIDELVINGPEYEPDLSSGRFDMCIPRSFWIEEGYPKEDIDEYNSHYPVAICISPYAVIDDIRDFLEKNKELIRSMLESHQKHPNVLKDYKRRNTLVAERDDFIFKNRHMDRKELSRLVNDKFKGPGLPSLTYQDVNKIISREEKRRGFK